jgi:GT2 family glycosyltransferase
LKQEATIALHHRLAASLSLLALPINAALLLFNLRRLIFLLVAAWDWLDGCRSTGVGQRLTTSDHRPPFTAHRLPFTILILVPLRNETASLPGLFDALVALDYPPEQLTIGLIDDGSTDSTAALLERYAAQHAHVQVLHNAASLGKAGALNAGLRRWPAGQLVMVYDADARPERASLRQIAAAFTDPAVAAAGGLVRPANGLASPVAYYSAVERLVHQQVTMRAKDRLRLAPAILGSNCAYRRRDLERIGGFPPGALLEDSYLTVALARRGRLIRFLPDAAAHDQVPETLRGYWRQHVRWGRGFLDVAARAPRDPSAFSSPAASLARQERRSCARATAGSGKPEGSGQPYRALLRLELRLFSLGYLDRLALLLGAGLLAAWAALRLQRAPTTVKPASANSQAYRRTRPAADWLPDCQPGNDLPSVDWEDRPGSAIMRALVGLIGLNLLLPYAQIVVALLAERAALGWWLRLPLAPLFFAVDVAAAVWSLLLSLGGRPQVWTPTERP